MARRSPPLKVKPDLKINFAGLEFANPVLVASGTFNYGEEMAKFYPLSKLGGIVTKSITKKPRPGHPFPRTYETKGGMLNAIGLANPGIEKFLSKKMPFLRTLGTRLVVNIAGSTVEEFVELAQRLSDVEGIDALEVNISCPNVKEGGLEFSATPQPAFRVLSAVRKATRLPLVAKLSPNTADIGAVARAAEEAGMEGVSLINTLVGMAVDLKTRRPILSNVTGGLSGPAVKPVALAMVYKVARQVKIPIMAIGGICNAADALEFMLGGATLVQIGTANFTDPLAAPRAVEGIEDFLKEKNIPSVGQLVGSLRTPAEEIDSSPKRPKLDELRVQT
ncbi:MAG: dihydroorotate dehydrogenase [candidate division Zixibacteria bacterium]|nr:dihydroorotate dehydrogenase [candidate division Zixibacteria bacterium]